MAQRVAGLHLAGVFLIDEPGRASPSGELARSIVGRVDIDNKGVSGVEGEYDERLAGVPGQLVRERDAAGPHDPGRTTEHRARATPGDDVVLTIDRSLQFATEQALLRQVAAVGARGARAIIQDPRTGDMLAMANVDVDPKTGQPVVSSANEALTTVFEPGSVNKVITAAAAIEEGLVNPDTVLQVPDHLQVSDHLFSDHDPHAVASWSVTDIVTRSSNIGTIMIAQMLGKDRIDEYLRKFGLGEQDRARLPGRVGGPHARPEGLVGHVDRHHPDRAGHLGDRAADARGLQRDRQRRRCTSRPAWSTPRSTAGARGMTRRLRRSAESCLPRLRPR